MSQSAGLATTPFTDAEKADIRRFCGYPAYGAGASGFQGWRFFQAYGLLEYRLASTGSTPNMAPAELQVVRLQLASLYQLETAIPGTGANLDTASAGPWVHNPNEQRDRNRLFDDWRRRLCGFMGVPPGPALSTAGACIV
jgi:hypothetical protein